MQEIKDLRLRIDTLINTIDPTTGALSRSREVKLAFTILQRAKMWLGQCLKELGTENPYPTSHDATSPVIEPQADHSVDTIIFPDRYDQTAKVKALRSSIEEVIKDAETLYNSLGEQDLTRKFMMAAQISITALIEAKMWLGMELNRIYHTQRDPA